MDENTSGDILTSGDLAEVEEAINDLHKSVDLNKSTNAELLKEIKKINKYNEETAKKQEAQQQADAEQQEQQNLEAEEQARIDAEVQADKEQQQLEQQETYQEILVDIRTQIELSNELQAVQTIWFGAILGMLFVKIIWDRLIRS